MSSPFSSDSSSRPEPRTPTKGTSSRPETRTPTKETSSRPETRTPTKNSSSRPEIRTPTKETSSRPKPRSFTAWRSGETPAFHLCLGFCRSFFSRRVLHAAMICCLAIVMLGADNTDKRYERVGHNMMCACSCGQILLECNHVGCPDSARMINELRNQIASGGSDKEVFNWFVAKYGAVVLASPIRGGFDNVAWIMPISVFLLAILGTALIARVWKARTAERTPLKIKGMTASSTDELRERIRRETHY